MAVNISTIICMLMCVVGVAEGWGYHTTSEPHHNRHFSLASRLRALEGKVHALQRQSRRDIWQSGWVSQMHANLMKRLTGNVANISQALGEEIHMVRQIAIKNRDATHEIHEMYRRHHSVDWNIRRLWKYIRYLMKRGGGTAQPPTGMPHRWTTRQWGQGTTRGWGPEPHTTAAPSDPVQIRFPWAWSGNTYANGGIVNYIKGHVEIYRDGRWGTICDDHFDDRDAAVICRTGGYDGGEYRNGTYKQKLKYKAHRIWLDDVACRGSERSILECPHLRWGKHNCDHSQDVGIMCYIGTPHPRPTNETSNPGNITYETVTRGTCPSIGLEECGNIAADLNLKFTTSAAYGLSIPGCVMIQGVRRMHFNTVPAIAKCSNYRKCLCQPRTAGPVRVPYMLKHRPCYHKCGSSYGPCESYCGAGLLCCQYGKNGPGCTEELKRLAWDGSKCVGYRYEYYGIRRVEE